ncbi:MAG TPA: hypothetical protein VEZ12_23985, partial [Herpetosiphonaceae bacterium]|nr:hypothetical protein [Herpetosiphonaceae bacterium]
NVDEPVEIDIAWVPGHRLHARCSPRIPLWFAPPADPLRDRNRQAPAPLWQKYILSANAFLILVNCVRAGSEYSSRPGYLASLIKQSFT